jgi:hypothetical protein
MIDRQARDRFCELLRHLASGQITNDEFQDNLPLKSTDPAVNVIFWNGAWLLYDDLREYKLIGKYRLSSQTKKEIARWTLFLKGDHEYRWPRLLWLYRFPGYLLTLLTVGIINVIAQRRLKQSGDIEVWPFLNREEYQRALEQPKYLRTS